MGLGNAQKRERPEKGELGMVLDPGLHPFVEGFGIEENLFGLSDSPHTVVDEDGEDFGEADL